MHLIFFLKKSYEASALNYFKKYLTLLKLDRCNIILYSKLYYILKSMEKFCMAIGIYSTL